MTSLVVLDFDATGIKQPARSAVAAAVKLGGEVHVLLSGTAVGDAAAAAAKIAGVTKVLVADDASLTHELAETTAALWCRSPRPTAISSRPPPRRARTRRPAPPLCWMCREHLHIEQGSGAGQHVFARGRGGGWKDMRIAGRQCDDEGGGGFGQLMRQRRVIGHEHLGHTRQLGGGGGGTGHAGTRDEYMHLAAQFDGGCHGGAGRLLDAGGIEIKNYERGHGQITFASLRSLSTSVATSATLMPALRPGGSDTLTMVRRGVTSTPRSAGFRMSICFLRAFMMLGSEA